jgi:hypothetical protein
MSEGCCPTENKGEVRFTMGVAYAMPTIVAAAAAVPMSALALFFMFQWNNFDFFQGGAE